METLNINIWSSGEINTSASKSKRSQVELPSPITQDSQKSSSSAAPTPMDSGNFADTMLSSSVPHPESFATTISASHDQVPSPMTELDQSAPVDSKVPTPMDFEENSSASPATKPKPRSTKRKSGSK